MKLGKWFALSAAALSVTLLAGCGSSSSSGSNGKTVVKVSWRDTGKGDPTYRVYTKSWINSFEKKHPKIKIELQPINSSESDYYSKSDLAMKSADTTPDIVAEDTFILPADAKAGYLTDLGKYVSKWDQWNQYLPSMKKGTQGADGKQYAVPGTTDSRGLWSNKALLKKAGLPENWHPQNWDDILSAAKKIKSVSGSDTIPMTMSASTTNGESVAMQTFEMLLYGTGETLYNDKTDKWNVDSQGIKDSLEFVNTVFNKDKTGPSLSVAMNSNYGSTIFQDKFPKGQVGIALDGVWDAANWTKDGAAPISNLTSKVGYTLMPTQKKTAQGSVTMSGGWAWSIPAKSKNKAAAWTVLKAMNTEKLSVKRAVQEGNLTPRKDAAKDPEYLKKPYIDTATKALKNAYFRPKSSLYPKISVLIQKSVEDVASGQKTPSQAAAKYAKDVKGIVGAKHTETQQ